MQVPSKKKARSGRNYQSYGALNKVVVVLWAEFGSSSSRPGAAMPRSSRIAAVTLWALSPRRSTRLQATVVPAGNVRPWPHLRGYEMDRVSSLTSLGEKRWGRATGLVKSRMHTVFARYDYMFISGAYILLCFTLPQSKITISPFQITSHYNHNIWPLFY
jgi:hypothetical protein